MLEMETEKINAEHLPTNSLAKKYSTVELFGNVTKMSSPDYFFYDRFLQELAESEVETPFERIFKVEKSSRTQEFTFKISYHDKNDEPQSFTEWKSFFSWTRISSWKFWRRIRKTKIYVLPVGPFPDFITRGSLNVDQVNLFEIILKFAEVYFPGISFTLLPAIEFKELGCKTRFHHRTRQLQILVSDVLEQLHKARPKDSFGIVGLLWVDLYPSEEENHIVGEGCFSTGCAALGFGHYSLKCIDGEVQKVEVKSADGTHQRNTNTTFSCSGKEGSPDHILSKCRKGESKHRHKSWKDGMKTVKERRQSGEYMHTKLLHTTSEIGLRNFSTGLKIPPLYSMRGARSMSYTDISSGNLMTIDKELTCSFLSLKEIGHQTRISSSSWLQLFSDDSSGFGSSFEDFEIINTIDENSSEPRSDELGGDLSVIDALPFGTDFMLTCAVLWRLLRAFSHEICHLFGLSHCSFYKCAMNTSHSIEEAESQPLFLCPVCLRKLQRVLKFEIHDRYTALRKFLCKQSECCRAKDHILSQGVVSRQGLCASGLLDPSKQHCRFLPAVTSLSKIISFSLDTTKAT